MWLGDHAGAGSDVSVYVMISNGVGVVMNGRVMRGTGNTAGEFGHVPIDLNAPRCLCGARGCWETYTSSLAWATSSRRARRAASPA